MKLIWLAGLLFAMAPGAVVAQTSATPLPPSRPQALSTTPAAPSAQGPVGAVSTAVTTGDPVSVERINASLNGTVMLSGDFVQSGPGNRRSEGRIYLQKPGRLRFEYKAPSALEIVADGRSVAVRDRKLATQDVYAIAQTPLKFLLKDQIDLRRDTVLKRIEQRPDAVSVRIEDRATLGGSSQITLVFDPASLALREWVVIDPQGYETTVRLANIDLSRRPDPKLFVINYERLIENNR